MTDNILTGRELDEAVARMMGWTEAEDECFVPPSLHGHRDTFQDCYAFYSIVLPWARAQGWRETVYNRDGASFVDMAMPGVFIPIEDRVAEHPDEIIARLNALVRAHEATQ